MVKWSKEVVDEVKMYQANDYDIQEDTPTHVVMKKGTASLLGHIVVFIFFGWWTIGIANVVYHLASVKKKKVMK